MFKQLRKQEEPKDFRVAVGAEPADRAISPLRADLKVLPQLFYGQLCYVIKDPVTLRYFRLQPIEQFLITQFDGKRTARDLLGILHQQFPESALTVQDVLRFVGMLHESHLLVGEGIAHAEWLGRQARVNRRRRWLEFASNFLFFKIPLFNPDKLLGVMDEALGKVLFHRTTGIAAILLVLAALGTVLARTDRLGNLPYSLLSWQNLMILYIVFVVTKVFHEFGHGLTTKHHGGEVSNMGVMWFVFTPSFYCDTSDAWMIPSRAARLWINAGGIVVELVLAALAAFVWAWTNDEALINQIALNVMISCSVATLFFNVNPLLRYDGYYFLSDLLEIPNLMTKSRQLLGCYAQKYLLGLKPALPPDARRVAPLVSYAVASSVYRWMVLFGIVTLIYYFFDGHGLGAIGTALASAYVVATVLVPAGKAIKFLWKQRWDIRKRMTYISAAAGVTAALLGGVAMLPWDMALHEPVVVLAERDESIFVRTPGYVDEVLADIGEPVKAGAVIVRLKDPALTTMLARAEAKRAEAEIGIATARMKNDPGAIAAGQTVVDAYDKQIAQLKAREEELVLRSPLDGVVIRDASLRRIAGNYVAPGTKLCRVIQADRLQARVSLPQQQAALVAEGMPVRIKLWSASGNAIEARVTRVSSTVSDQLLHPALASTVKGDVQVTTDAKGNAKSLGRRSTVIIDLGHRGEFLADGMTGRAEITVRRTTVLGRIWRSVLDSTTPDWHL